MNAAFLCLGGNIGDRLGYMNRAKTIIEERCGKIKAQSPVYETQAWGNETVPDYYNQCIQIETFVSPEVLLQLLLEIEKELGRYRSGTKNEPRPIDIDVLLFEDAVITTPDFTLPHPRLHLRRFVLVPLNKIAAKVIHPVLKKTIAQLLEECKDTLTVTEIPHVHLH